MNRREERDANLIVVAAAEEYGMCHQMPVKNVLALFEKHKVSQMLRSQYEVLHTMDLAESAYAAEAYLRGVL